MANYQLCGIFIAFPYSICLMKLRDTRVGSFASGMTITQIDGMRLINILGPLNADSLHNYYSDICGKEFGIKVTTLLIYSDECGKEFGIKVTILLIYTGVRTLSPQKMKYCHIKEENCNASIVKWITMEMALETFKGSGVRANGDGWLDLLYSQMPTVRVITYVPLHGQRDCDYEECIRDPTNFATLRQKHLGAMYTTLELFQRYMFMVALEATRANTLGQSISSR